MATKTIDISCSECGKTITMTAKDAHIASRLNGGCPRLSVTVKCPHCQKTSTVRATTNARELLSERLKNRDYDDEGGTIIASSPDALLRVLGILGTS